MGAAIFKAIFSSTKQKSYSEELEQLQKELSEAEELKLLMERSEKRISHCFIYYFTIGYIGLAFVCLFFFPVDWTNRTLAVLVLICTPVLFWLLWKLIKWFYVNRVSFAGERLDALKKRKRQLLDELKSTESYNKVQDVLRRYADPISEEVEMLDCEPSLAHSPVVIERHRSLQHQTQLVQSPKLARALVSPDRGLFVRIFELIAQSGPQHRFALICNQCRSHNGMAFPEEVDSIEYKCAFCGSHNKPIAKVHDEEDKEKNA